MRPLFLIGLPGVGKSTIGRIVAERLGVRFVDTDLFVESRYHATISSMIGYCGIDKFRKRERVALLELLQTEDTLIATGGGLPIWEDNMDRMLAHGLVVYLRSPLDILADRLYSVRATRPAVADKTRSEVRDYLKMVLEKREPYYSRAQVVVPIGHLRTAEEERIAAEQVIEAIRQYMEKEDA
ncbi:MAG: shikimate kinase [Porphyromonas sp.]|uniref:shikimate kinase n=1 Tax=Porphyromonas sp. TaxID=1924944 RepID=UPI002A90EE5F|nr:shikimate kinase [Porphyromonas sp.]MDD7469211.1 shikimate kinase [Bacteroidales bacterium]MDY6102496.1 shikimate kinase [Porphyromonas sp.]